MKPSERIYQLVKEQEERNRLGGYNSQYKPGFVEILLPAILQYLDEKAEKP